MKNEFRMIYRLEYLWNFIIEVSLCENIASFLNTWRQNCYIVNKSMISEKLLPQSKANISERKCRGIIKLKYKDASKKSVDRCLVCCKRLMFWFPGTLYNSCGKCIAKVL